MLSTYLDDFLHFSQVDPTVQRACFVRSNLRVLKGLAYYSGTELFCLKIGNLYPNPRRNLVKIQS